MANYANQNKIIGIPDAQKKIRHMEGDTGRWMQPFDWEKMQKIMHLLNGNEYKFYMYLFSWAGKEEGYNFSPADLNEKLNFGEDTARKIFKRFIEYGFLVKEYNHVYKFDSYPEKTINK